MRLLFLAKKCNVELFLAFEIVHFEHDIDYPGCPAVIPQLAVTILGLYLAGITAGY